MKLFNMKTLTAALWLGSWSCLTVFICHFTSSYFWYLSLSVLFLFVGGIRPLKYFILFGIALADPRGWLSGGQESKIADGEIEGHVRKIPFTSP